MRSFATPGDFGMELDLACSEGLGFLRRCRVVKQHDMLQGNFEHVPQLHFQFFSPVTFESQKLTEEKRSSRIWQPPILTLWNFNTVPWLPRVTPCCKLMFAVGCVLVGVFFRELF